MNQRRPELIHKDIRGLLAAEVRAELERLERQVKIAIEKSFPASRLFDGTSARIEARLGRLPEAPSE